VIPDHAPVSPGRDGPAAPQDEPDVPLRSLQDDVEALIEDGRTYLEAEIAYQRSRAVYVVDEAKTAFIYVVAAALLAALTLIGLTVGLIIALATVIGAWAASGVVVGALALCTGLLLMSAQRRWTALMETLQGKKEDDL
jgi:hypothetical protein